jgi:peptidoglycan/LPS O-acetylase OafA/YrhL
MAAFAVRVSDSSQRAAFAPRAGFHVPSLDGLRAVSFLIVFAAHAGAELVPGGFGVTVFFFLSGYLITTLLRLEGEKTGHYSLRHFYLRRLLRIWPPFYIVLLGAVALRQSGFLRADTALESHAVASQLLHFSNYWIATHGWGGVAVGTGVYWSLAVEEHFYLAFPALFILLDRRGWLGTQKAFVFWGLCALVLAWRCFLVFGWKTPTDRTYLCSDTRIDSILFGCALAVWNNPRLDPAGRSPLQSQAVVRTLAVLGFGVLLVSFAVRGAAFRESVRYTLQGAALTPLFVAAIRWPRALVFQPLNWKPMQFIGTLSYTLYLVHQVVLAAFAQHTSLAPFSRASAALFASLAIAWAMYQWVEKPCAKLRRRLSATD